MCKDSPAAAYHSAGAARRGKQTVQRSQRFSILSKNQSACAGQATAAQTSAAAAAVETAEPTLTVSCPTVLPTPAAARRSKLAAALYGRWWREAEVLRRRLSSS